MTPGAPQSRHIPARPDALAPRHWPRYRTAVFVGAGLAVLGTMLPWAGGVYWGEPFGWTGWHLYYLHGPRFTAAFPPLVFAVAAATAAGASTRRPATLRLAMGPGFLIMGYVAFTYATYAAGPFGTFIRQFSGYSSSFLGAGFWLMAAGGLVIAAVGLAADRSPPDVVLWRAVTWTIAGSFEFALLFTSPARFAPVFVLGMVVAGLVLWTRRVARRGPRPGPPAITEPVGSPDAERIDPERAEHLPASAELR